MDRRHGFGTLDLLRGLAAAAVLAWHFPAVWQPRYWSAYLAVDLFFGVSGVVVAHAYEAKLREGWRPWRFVLVRIIRLWPMYLLGSAVGVAAFVAETLRYGHEAWRFRPLVPDLLRAALLLPRPASGAAFPLDGPAWSLFCELAVNILYGAVLARWSSRRLVAVALAGAGLTVAGGVGPGGAQWALNLGALSQHLWVGLARALFGFTTGVLIWRCRAAGRLPRTLSSPLYAAGLFLLLLAVPGEGRWALPAALAVALAGMPLLVAAATRVEPRGALLRASRVAADLSYPLYAVHAPLYGLAGILAAAGHGPAVPAYLLAAALALPLAFLLDRYVDRPARRRLSELARLPRMAPTLAPPL